jgi:CheY-like chemotaxis protein
MTGATGRRVLLVDDEPDILTVARIALTSYGGYAVRTCTSGAEALAVAPEFAPDLIIIDVMMPDMDGPSTLRLLRETAGLRDTPVVFLTAQTQPIEVTRYRALGAVDVLAKPFDHKIMVEQVGRVLNNVAAPREEVDSKVAAIAARFATRLPERIGEIERAWADLGDGDGDGDAAEMLHIVVHRLAGSASSFGYGKIGDIARGLERLLERVFDDGERPNPEETSDIEAYIAALRRELP